MNTSDQIHLSPGIPDGIGRHSLEDATLRILGYCTNAKSGWHTYDLPSSDARKRGHFNEIAPWSLLWADALGGRITPSNLASFDHEYRSVLADKLRQLPACKLEAMDDEGAESVAILCRSGFPGAWAPKMTKLLALYRPDAIPVLDGHVALAMGFERTAFSAGKEPRWERIRQTLFTLRDILRNQSAELSEIRERVSVAVPSLGEATDLRLLDIIIWTSQDDRMSRPGSPANYWRARGTGEIEVLPPSRMDPVPV